MSEIFREIDDSVTAPQGYRAGSIASGIKANANIQDVAILVADIPCIAVGAFTSSRTQAAPVQICQERLKSGRAQAVIVNSGNANCATGKEGLLNAYRMTAATARQFGLEEELVLCSSTGIIGRQLPIEKIENGIAQIEPGRGQGNAFAEAIMTTDTRPKRMALAFSIDGREVRLGGATKGAGMIYPNMATMLCYLTTDAAVEHDWLQKELREVVAETFNMIAIDGDMSTNDSCILFANGLAGNKPLNSNHPEGATFRRALRIVSEYLAREIARDGEGASKLMTVHVRGARNKADAIKAARGVTLSPIWQCALTGEDPNWGRIVAALGASGCEIEQDSYDIWIKNIQVTRGGVAAQYNQGEAHTAMSGEEVVISIDLHLGDGEATAWGCNLSEGYIQENTHYKR